jgi:hypothetical protein
MNQDQKKKKEKKEKKDIKKIYTVLYFSYVCGEIDDSEIRTVKSFCDKDKAKKCLLEYATNLKDTLNEDNEDEDIQNEYVVVQGEYQSNGEYMVVPKSDLQKSILE